MNVLGISGSLRRDSFNTALLRAAQTLTPPEMTLTLFDRLGEIPPYNQDVESAGDPASVAAFKTAIAAADALLIATPEYNYGIPGVLKNAIDWASRPPASTPLQRKPAALIGGTMGMGGTIRAQLSLRQTFLFTETMVMAKPEMLVPRIQEKFDTELRLTDAATRDHLSAVLRALGEWAQRW